MSRRYNAEQLALAYLIAGAGLIQAARITLGWALDLLDEIDTALTWDGQTS